MKNQFLLLLLATILIISCQKTVHETIPEPVVTPANPTTAAVLYTIQKGQQYCDKNNYTTVSVNELKFKVKFDSTAIYTTVNPANQGDINKLYGFSVNNAQHHLFSARFGWRWYNNAIEIFAYIYNNGVVAYKKIGTASINANLTYSIKVQAENYLFSFGDTVVTMPRASTTATGLGYKLFPYFGGDELAPHDVKILIEELQN